MAWRRHADLRLAEFTGVNADRLDLGRVGKRPDPARLGTAAARDPELLEWAYKRSVR